MGWKRGRGNIYDKWYEEGLVQKVGREDKEEDWNTDLSANYI